MSLELFWVCSGYFISIITVVVVVLDDDRVFGWISTRNRICVDYAESIIWFNNDRRPKFIFAYIWYWCRDLIGLVPQNWIISMLWMRDKLVLAFCYGQFKWRIRRFPFQNHFHWMFIFYCSSIFFFSRLLNLSQSSIPLFIQ